MFDVWLQLCDDVLLRLKQLSLVTNATVWALLVRLLAW